MGSEHYCLRWNNHQSNLLGVFSQLLRDESLVDVTLACSEGHSIRAHKVVLSACSSYFQTLFVDHPSRHPIVILKDVRFSELRTLIEFMYKGEVNVEYCQLSALLKTAESLKIKGLAEMTNLGPSSRDYKQDAESEQIEPTELVNKRPVEEQDHTQTPPRICRTPERPTSREPLRSGTPSEDCGPSDMSIHSNSNPITSCSALPGSSICNRLPSPLNSEPLPGPSGLPPVQQVPLSLKKEVDWGGGSDEKNAGESSSDYSRHPHDSELDRGDEGSPRLYPCMYCGASFPHQSKLTRHILSHSLETLKYREQLQHAGLGLPEPLHLMESHFSGRGPSAHPEPPDPTDQPPTPMDLELVGDGGGVVLCKFCGKSFPEVGSLIAHLPVHTGDRPFKCEFCGKAFKLRHHMKDHCRVHTGERPFRCSLCAHDVPRRNTTLATLQDETSRENSLEVERCFNSPGGERPSSTHSSRSSTPFTFPLPSLATSLLEVGLMHPSLLSEEMFRCSVCMAAFPSVWLLEQHTALQHMGSLSALDKPFICDQCGQSYRYRSAYIKHREQNHRARLPADKLFSCDVCGMQFRYLKSFKKHRLNHALERLHGKSSDISLNENKDESDKDSPMENSSDHVSSSNEAINNEESEMETVTIKKENSSDETGEGVSSDVEKAEIEQDDTIDSAVSSAPGASVSETIKKAQETNLISLLQVDSMENQRERRFACPFCGKCVRSKENLKLHVRKHTGERPFVCLFCGRAFGGKSDLTRHLRIHTGERPYHCDMCGKCFARADYLSKHLTTHIHTPR